MSHFRPTLVILTHSTNLFWKWRYLIHLLIPFFEANGFRVVVTNEAEGFVPGDVALLHVDLSVIPASFQPLLERYPLVINKGATDIRKRNFSQLLVENEGPDPGMVIVKTDWNAGGQQEIHRWIIESAFGRFLKRFTPVDFIGYKFLHCERLRSWHRRRALSPHAYPIYAKRGLVPAGVWKNKNLVVERFVGERDGDYYCCRHWLFAGEKGINRITRSLSPVVKLGTTPVTVSDPVPDELWAIRKKLGFDYGKFDYGIVNGKAVLYDVNRTPGAAADPHCHSETVPLLAEGMLQLMRQSSK